MYKLISLDCDGTLLNSKKEITEKTINAIRQAERMGIKIVLASARPFYRLKPYLSQLGLLTSDQYTIAFNGGLVLNNTEDDIIFSKAFSKDQVLELVKIGEEFNTQIFIYTRNEIISNINDEKYKKKNPDVNFIVANLEDIEFTNDEVFKLVYVNTPEETLKLRTELPRDLHERYEISSSVPQFVEFVEKGISKSHALKLIGERAGILSSEVIAFGDQDNDLQMFEFAGYSVAMGNSCDEIKYKADFVTVSNDEDGVAHAIEKLILNKTVNENIADK